MNMEAPLGFRSAQRKSLFSFNFYLVHIDKWCIKIGWPKLFQYESNQAHSRRFTVKIISEIGAHRKGFI